MVREKRTNVKRLPPIDLDLDRPDQKRLWDHYQKLSKSGNAADWIRRTLVAALPALSNDDAPASDAVTTLTYAQAIVDAKEKINSHLKAQIVPSELTPETFEDDNVRYVDIED